jgi:hypothetical protein
MSTVVIHLINTALALLFWLIIGRFVLDVLIGGRRNFFSDLFHRATDPVLSLTRRITPAFIADRYIPWLSLLLLIGLRLLLLPLL